MRVDHHIALLEKPRTVILRDLVGSLVRPGDVVLDAGTGSGILAVWAAQAGASEVWAVDREHPELALEVAQANGVADKVKWQQADLTDWQPPRRFDVVFGMLYENDPRRDEFVPGLFTRLLDVALAPDGRALPDQVLYRARLVDWPEQDHASARMGWARRVQRVEDMLDLNLSPLVDRLGSGPAMDLFPPRQPDGRLAGGRALSADEVAIDLDYGKGEAAYPAGFSVEVVSPGLATAVIWTQELRCQGVTLFSNESISWLDGPRAVVPGQTVRCALDQRWRSVNLLSAEVQATS